MEHSIFILDNCPAHKKHEAELRALVEGKCDAKLIFLAPYSPIDNPIEVVYNCFKACWRRHGMWLTASHARAHSFLPIELLRRRGDRGTTHLRSVRLLAHGPFFFFGGGSGV